MTVQGKQFILMTMQAVFFDMGGTIETYQYDRELRIRNAHLLRKVLIDNGIDLQLDDSQLAAFISRGFKSYKTWCLASLVELPPLQIWSRFILKEVREGDRLSERAAEELTLLYETRFHERKLRPEIPEVLSRLAKMKLKIGCISNVASHKQVPLYLKKYGIIQYFHPIVLSSEYGRRKPDPAIFHHAAQLAKLPTDVCIYVGDKISRDILGAKKAGYGLAIQVYHDFDGETDDTEIKPDYYLKNMADLIPILEKELHQPSRRKNVANREDKKIKAIFFDAGDILYHRPERAKHLDRYLKKHGIKPNVLDQSRKASLQDAAYQGKLGRHECYRQILQLYGITANEDLETGMLAMEEDDITVEIMPGAPETLQELKREGFRLGIITDTALPIHVKLKWFDDAGFGNVWSTITSSKVLGYRKPNPRIYRHALAQALVRADEAVFVGHKITELDGASQVGLVTVAFNYEPDARADFFVESFCDIPKVSILNKR